MVSLEFLIRKTQCEKLIIEIFLKTMLSLLVREKVKMDNEVAKCHIPKK